MGSSPSRLAQNGPQPRVAFAGLPASAFSGALVVSGTQPRANSDFRHQTTRGDRFHSRNRPSLDHLDHTELVKPRRQATKLTGDGAESLQVLLLSGIRRQVGKLSYKASNPFNVIFQVLDKTGGAICFVT